MKKYALMFVLTLLVSFLFLNDGFVKADVYRTPDYNYNFWNEVVPNTPAYDVEKVVNIEELKGVYNFGDISDLYVGKDKVFIVDKSGNQVIVTDYDLNFITRINLFWVWNDEKGKYVIKTDEEGQQVRLAMPQGVYEANNGDIYVADTGYRDENGAARIAVFSLGTDNRGDTFYYLKNIINKPANYIGKTQFIPQKLVVDNAYRIYTIVQGGNEGIIELNADGSFSRFFGLTEFRVNILANFWKNIASEEQRAKMKLTFAPPYNNLDIDQDGFIYATNADETAVNPIVRINPSGVNVLREKGYFPPMGDIYRTSTDDTTLATGQSAFYSVSVNDSGIYAALDTSHGRVFVYNFDGELLTIIGNLGNTVGEFKNPSDVSWLNDKILVSDQDTGFLTIYRPTKFGQYVIDGTKAYYNGEWENAGDNWLKALKLDSNYDIAYVGYGKMLYMNEKYKEALEYFKLGNNRTYYSMAYNKYRSEYLRDHFFIFIAPLVLLAGWVLYTEYRYNRKEGGN